MANQKPEEIARDQIDTNLEKAGWVVQSMDEMNLAAAKGVCVREYPTSSGPVDYAIFLNEELVGVIEAKREEAAVNITRVQPNAMATALR